MSIKHRKQQLVHMKIILSYHSDIGLADIDRDWESVSGLALKMSMFPPHCFTKHRRTDWRSSWLPTDSWRIRCRWRHFAAVPHVHHSSDVKCFISRRALIYLLSKCIQLEWGSRQQPNTYQTEREFRLLAVHHHHVTPAVTSTVALSCKDHLQLQLHGALSMHSIESSTSDMQHRSWGLSHLSHRVDRQPLCSLEHLSGRSPETLQSSSLCRITCLDICLHRHSVGWPCLQFWRKHLCSLWFYIRGS